MSAWHSFHGLMAMGATSMLGIQTFVIIGGVLKLIPLTGVTMPFVSYGGTSMVSSSMGSRRVPSGALWYITFGRDTANS